MKKFIIVLLAVFLTFGLAACGGKESSVEGKNVTESENKNNQENENDDTTESGDDNASKSENNGVATENEDNADSSKTPEEDENRDNETDTLAEDEINDDEANGTEGEEQGNESIDVNKNLFGVEITLPASMFELSGQSVDEIIADAKADGIDDVIINSDGSVTYKMSKAKHDEKMEELRTGFIETVDELTNGDFVSIKDVTYNKNFSEFTLVVDRASYESSFDIFATFALGFTGMFYQLFDGENPDNIKVTIQIKDVNSGEVFDTVVYPDEMGI